MGEGMITKDYVDAMSRQWLSPSGRRLTRRELQQLQQIVSEDERLEGLVSGTYERGVCLLAATNKRLILVDKKLFDLRVDRINFSQIESVEFERAVFAASILIKMPGARIYLKWVNPNRVREFAQYVSNAVADTWANASASGGAAPGRLMGYAPTEGDAENPITKLERLGALYKQGFLNEAEFLEQKQSVLAAIQSANRRPTKNRPRLILKNAQKIVSTVTEGSVPSTKEFNYQVPRPN